jgi:hypothetical protein
MKRIDYFWPRAATQISGIVFISQAIIEVIGGGIDFYAYAKTARAAIAKVTGGTA